MQGYVCYVKCRTWTAVWTHPREAILTTSTIAVLLVHVDFWRPQIVKFPKVFEAPREYFPVKCPVRAHSLDAPALRTEKWRSGNRQM